MPEYMTVREVAQTYKINELTVRRHIRKGQLPAVKIGGRVRVRKEDLERFVTPVSVQQKRLIVPPASPEEIARRKALAGRVDALRAKMKPLGTSTPELVRIAREEEEAKYEHMSVVTIPLSDLRRDLSTIVPNLTQPVFVTQRGRVKAVLIDIEAYNNMLDELDDARLAADPDFQASVAEAQAGGGKPLEDVLSKYGL